MRRKTPLGEGVAKKCSYSHESSLPTEDLPCDSEDGLPAEVVGKRQLLEVHEEGDVVALLGW